MDTENAPQIIPHIQESVTYTPFEARWIPDTANFVVLGQNPKATGTIRIYDLDGGKCREIHNTEKKFGFKCGTFNASPPETQLLATGDFEGNLDVWDLEDPLVPIWSSKAHNSIINCIDGCGGANVGYGAPEIATGSRDGRDTAVVFVRKWDVRETEVNDCDCDIKLFDLRTNTLLWDTNVKNGVCHVQFDRKDIAMNKLGVSTLEGKLMMYDLRTFHPEEGFAGRVESVNKSTVWGCTFLPQNRELLACSGGNGHLAVYKYSYPKQRSRKDGNGIEKGVPGTLELLNEKELSTQPIVSLDWHKGKIGLCCMACLDQTVRVAIVTKLNLY
uniref:WD repeat-containing protein 92 n=1 Tax=Chromera velia CCMP2878 TaxID=1169474 RepID=A0A0G4I8Z7_9ALVE|eukprot:Cvel_12030.t1-p1 / transcript=Cvel_12030.t1 / gene=Cvel_12030 / organism=Chromera_velia_CCMP2878 / gene_product=WD repeat-containing protein 92, putative / transcript_product=WD repeat-containing protein 92, putative / location=Cvel_scaffold772:36798-42174(+) / protein_length=329 / sequence_SO=supercontig / SO=protein_coding / is_pseudo=false